MALFKKKCQYCGEKINKEDEIWAEVKVPEFKGVCLRPFCSKEHAELYQKNIKGTPRRNFCPRCGI